MMSGTSSDINESRKIKQLETSVINRIAAGEIIIQPANALKEMIENSIDADATMIEILVKDGGLKLLQITDNGKGINKNDLPLLCERFATSKIAKFEDLESISTYGFRGEALASISHISRLSVITKVKKSPLAFKCFYSNGKLVTPNFKSGDSAIVEPKPIAGKDGTQIIVEDLFYNAVSRLKSLKSKSEEFAKILDVISRYAIHTENVGFSIKKFGESNKLLSSRPGLSLKERIRTIYGTSIANDLITVDDCDVDGESNENREKYGLIKVKGAITNTNYINKKRMPPVFFINQRLVSCDPLRRALNSIYQIFLSKGNQPFIYLSLEIEPKNLDVNIHPTKSEVRFLHEDEIIEIVTAKVHEKLSSVDTSRKYKTQGVLFDWNEKKRKRESIQDSDSPSVKYRQENKLVRIDTKQSKLQSFLSNQTEVGYHSQMAKQFLKKDGKKELQDVEIDSEINENSSDEEITEESGSISNIPYKIKSKQRNNVTLDSIKALRKKVIERIHKPLTSIFNNASYVGIVDEKKRLCCFQFDLKLYICDYSSVLSELFYQIALSEFLNYGKLNLSEHVLLEDILEPLYSSRENLKPKEDIIRHIMSMKDMYKEYFQIEFLENEQNKAVLTSLPIILKDVNPPLSKLPYFIYRLGDQISYQEEEQCLDGILRQIGLLYTPESISNVSDDINIEDKEYEQQLNAAKRDRLDNVLEHILFPIINSKFLATEGLVGDILQIADLPGLYRVFERC